MSESAPAAAKKIIIPGDFAPELFSAFSTIRNIARAGNCDYAVPEVVFLGRHGAGKSSLIESFLGHTMMPLTDTLRPVEIRMVNNPECENPRVTVLRDFVLSDAFPEEVDVPLTEVQKVLQARNTVRVAEPTRVLYESKYCMDMTIYDTPGLLHPTEGSGEEAEVTEDIVLALAKPSNRLLVCVEEACDWGLIEGIDFVNRVDPRHERTVFVFNKMSNLVNRFSSAPELAAFLRGGTQLPLTRGGRVTDKVFFTNMPTGVGRSDKPAIFKRKVAALLTAQLQSLEALQYDSRFEGSIGALAVQKRILIWVWNRYQNIVLPAIIHQIHMYEVEVDKCKTESENQLETISHPQDLREIASSLTSSWVDTISAMLNRSLIGKPSLNGQTLSEECAVDDAFAAWTDANMERIDIDRSKVGGSHDKLYGAAQFERLLKEFRAVVSSAVSIDVSSDEVATALGSTRSDMAPDVAWAACHLVQQKSAFLFPPLVQQLVARAKAIFRQIVEIADRLPGHGWVNADRVGEEGEFGEAGAKEYPHLTMEVKSMYYDLVDTLCKQCVQRCTQEFFDAKVLNFELRNNYTDLMDSCKSSSAQKFTLQLTKALFEKVKDRFMQNVTLTCYDMLLVTLQTKLSSIILARIAQTTDKQLEELLETPVAKQRLQSSITKYEGIIDQIKQNRDELMTAAGVFAHINNQ